MTVDQQKKLIAEKLNQGLSLAEVQKFLAAEHGVNITYLDLRMLAAELEVDWQKHDPVKPAKPAEDSDADSNLGKTVVSVSKVVRPGAAMSGDVQFASGAKAEWFLDTLGRLGLNPSPGSSQPTEDDIQDFQLELQRKLGGGM